MKRVERILAPDGMHWVGDGFPVKSLFTYHTSGERISPFLLLDHGGPTVFEPADRARGVGEHPHRGFETVTICYAGEVEHRDSAGHSGRIGPGDVQWMTAASGVVHEEKHSAAFTRSGGPFEMAQLWVNLPGSRKMSPPAYQTLLAAEIPVVPLPAGAGSLRVIAGGFEGTPGAARTCTPVDVWDLTLAPSGRAELAVPEGRTAMLVVLRGEVALGRGEKVGADRVALFAREGGRIALESREGATALFLGGEPLGEPIVGYGPFVMNTEAEIRAAIADYQEGRLGRLD